MIAINLECQAHSKQKLQYICEDVHECIKKYCSICFHTDLNQVHKEKKSMILEQQFQQKIKKVLNKKDHYLKIETENDKITKFLKQFKVQFEEMIKDITIQFQRVLDQFTYNKNYLGQLVDNFPNSMFEFEIQQLNQINKEIQKKKEIDQLYDKCWEKISDSLNDVRVKVLKQFSQFTSKLLNSVQLKCAPFINLEYPLDQEVRKVENNFCFILLTQLRVHKDNAWINYNRINEKQSLRRDQQIQLNKAIIQLRRNSFYNYKLLTQESYSPLPLLHKQLTDRSRSASQQSNF